MKRLLPLLLLAGCVTERPEQAERRDVPDLSTNVIWVTNTITVFETNHIFVQHLYTNGIIDVGNPALPPLKPQPMPARLPPQ